MDSHIKEYIKSFLCSIEIKDKSINNLKETLCSSNVNFYNYKFSNIENAYINRTYKKRCLKLWLQYVTLKIKQIIVENEYKVNEIVETLLNEHLTLDLIPDIYKSSNYLKLLIKEKENECKIVYQFKTVCSNEVAQFELALDEIYFLTELTQFILYTNFSENFSKPINLLEFANNSITLKSFVSKICNYLSNQNSTFYTYASKLLLREKFYLEEKIRNIIKSYTQNTKLNVENINGNNVLIVEGAFLVLSRILSQIEIHNFEEVHFVCPLKFVCDISLSNTKWNGKNIVVVAKILEISDQVEWNISGANGDSINSLKAENGAFPGQNGNDGKHGNAGESGGNVFINVNEFVNPENLTIISNGGNGSNGESGGDGCNGKNGIGIDPIEFNKDFPPTARWGNRSAKRDRDITIKSIKNRCKNNYEWEQSGYCWYFKGTSIQGLDITFSHYCPSFLTRSSYILIKGTNGDTGGVGGGYGLGGEAGFEGSVVGQPSEIRVIKNAGNIGKNGEGGLSGKPGINGWDMGYTDYDNWSDAKKHGYDKTSKLSVVKSTSDSRVWCWNRKEYVDVVRASYIDTDQRNFSVSKSQRESATSKECIKVKRKNAIDINKVLDNYSSKKELFSEIKNIQNKLEFLNTFNSTNLSDITILDIKQESQVNRMCDSKNIFKSTNKNKIYDKLKIKPKSFNLEKAKFINTADYSSIEGLFALSLLAKKGQVDNEKIMFIQKLIDETKKLKNTNTISKFKIELEKIKLANLKILKLRGMEVKYIEKEDNITFNKDYNLSIINYLEESSEVLDVDVFYEFANSGALDTNDLTNKILEKFKRLKFDEKCETQFNSIIFNFLMSYYEDENEEFIEIINDFYNETEKNENSKLNNLKTWFRDQISYFKKADDKGHVTQNNFNWCKYSKIDKIINLLHLTIQKEGCKCLIYREIVCLTSKVDIVYCKYNYEKQVIEILSKHIYNEYSERSDYFYFCQFDGFIKLYCFNLNKYKSDLKMIQKGKFYDRILRNYFNIQSENELNKVSIVELEVTNSTFFYENKQLLIELATYWHEDLYKELIGRIKKLKQEYCGCNLPLYGLSMIFFSEGLLIPLQICYILINEVLKCSVENQNILGIYSWIIASVPQEYWIVEIIILQFKNKYSLLSSSNIKNLREALKLINHYDILICMHEKLNTLNSYSEKFENVLESVKLLNYVKTASDIPLNNINLCDWRFVLLEQYYSDKLIELCSESEYLKKFIELDAYRLTMIRHNHGENNVESLLENLKLLNCHEPQKLTSIFQGVLSGEFDLHDFISCDSKKSLDLYLQSNESLINNKSRNINEITNYIKQCSNTSISVKQNLEDVKSTCESINNISTREDISFRSYLIDDIAKYLSKFCIQLKIPNSIFNFNEECYLCEELFSEDKRIKILLTLLDRAIELTRGFQLRDTQKVAILLLLKNSNNLLEQVTTGEGKSLIVTCVAIIKALEGKYVDIITSSTVLATRDAESEPPKGCKDIYGIFNIKVGHNCSINEDERRRSYSTNQVVYGNVANFQRDYLLDRFLNKNILGKRKLELIIVDEVDSLLLDKGNNVLYLSHELPGFNKLESVYKFIWQLINDPSLKFMSSQEIKDCIHIQMYNQIKQSDLKYICEDFGYDDEVKIWDGFISSGLIDRDGFLLIKFIDELNYKFLEEKYLHHEMKFKYFFNNILERNCHIQIPKYLKNFIDLHLNAWIENAMSAKLMMEGFDYIVDVDRSNSKPDRNPLITIIDNETGTDLHNSQWDEGLHQFLQIKHGCRLTMQSLKAVFISNVSYFKLYDKLYGLTGTLGSNVERELLNEIHSVDFVTIPTAQKRQFHEYPTILCPDKLTRNSEIIISALEMVKQNRSILIICQSIYEVEDLEKDFQMKGFGKNLKIYKRDYEEFDITKQNEELCSGVIIIATNLAGRGSDIKISSRLKNANGLHVCISYFPSNYRIKQQALGRASRCGDPGSGQIIIIDKSNTNEKNSHILKLEIDRDKMESARIAVIKNFYISQILTEEKYLSEFMSVFKLKKKELMECEVSEDMRELLLKGILDQWAFWLDSNSKRISNGTHVCSINNDFYELLSSISNLTYNGPYTIGKNFLGYLTANLFYMNDFNLKKILYSNLQFNTVWDDWIKDPFSKIKIAKYLNKMNYCHEASILLNSIIQTEECCSLEASYNLSSILISNINWNECKYAENGNVCFNNSLIDFKLFQKMQNVLYKCQEQFESSTMSELQICACLEEIRDRNYKEHQLVTPTIALKSQKQNICQINSIYSKAITDILGHNISSLTFSRNDIDIETSNQMYNFLKSRFLISKYQIVTEFQVPVVKKLANKYFINKETFKKFLIERNGKFISMNVLLKDLNREFVLPSVEDFWQELLEKDVISKEVKFFQIDMEKLKLLDPSLEKIISKLCSKNSSGLMSVFIDDLEKDVILKYNLNSSLKKFKANQLVEIIGEKRLKYIKNMNIVSENYYACFNIKLAKKVSLKYSCISKTDFESEWVNSNESSYIVRVLLDLKILSETSIINMYKFEGGFNALQELPDCCMIYFERIELLLNHYFSYKLALECIIKHCEKDKNITECQIENNDTINNKVQDNFAIPLKVFPHKDIISDLISSNLLLGRKVVKKDCNVKQLLQQSYTPFIWQKEFVSYLIDCGILFDNKVQKKLIQELINKKWLKRSCFEDIQKYFKSIFFNVISNSIVNILPFLLPGLEAQKLFSFISNTENADYELIYEINDITLQEPLLNFKDIEDTLRVIINRKYLLSQSDIHNFVETKLNSCRSNLMNFDHPKAYYQNIYDVITTGELVQELHLYHLNGLGDIIILNEKKWTKKMIANATVVIVFGLVQCAIGLAIEIYSCGLMTHVGAAVLGEGISDIIYGMTALARGTFSWDDYKWNKIVSVVVSMCTVGVGAYLSNGAKLNRIGLERAGRNVFVNGKEVAKSSGKSLFDAVGYKYVAFSCGKRFLSKLAENIAYSGAHFYIDEKIKNLLSNFSTGLASSVLMQIEDCVLNHTINSTLEKLIKTCGEEVARDQVQIAIQKIMSNDSTYFNEFMKYISKFSSGICAGFSEACKKQHKATGNKSQYVAILSIISYVNKFISFGVCAKNIYELKSLSENLLGEFQSNFEGKIKHFNHCNANSCSDVDKDLDISKIKMELMENIKQAFQHQGKKIIEANLVSPIINFGTNKLVEYSIKGIKLGYVKLQKYRIKNQLNALKESYNIDDNEESDVNEKEEYIKAVMKLMSKVRSRELFAEMLLEGTPMNATCINATVYLLSKLYNISDLTIIVENSNGDKSIFSTNPNNLGLIKSIKLDSCHFVGGDQSYDNNCFFAALLKEFPELKDLSPEQFREMIAGEVVNNDVIGESIENGWHEYSMNRGFYGGATPINVSNFVKDNKILNLFPDNFSTNRLIGEECVNKICQLYDILKDPKYRVEIKDNKLYICNSHQKSNKACFILTDDERKYLNMDYNIDLFDNKNNSNSIKGIYAFYCTENHDDAPKFYAGKYEHTLQSRLKGHVSDVDYFTYGFKKVVHAKEHWEKKIESMPNITDEDRKILTSKSGNKTQKDMFNMTRIKYNLPKPSDIYKVVNVLNLPDNADKPLIRKMEVFTQYLTNARFQLSHK